MSSFQINCFLFSPFIAISVTKHGRLSIYGWTMGLTWPPETLSAEFPYTGWSTHTALGVLRSVVRLHIATLMTQRSIKRILWLIHELLWPSKTLSAELPYTGWSAHPALGVLRSVVRLHVATLMTQRSRKRILWLIHELLWPSKTLSAQLPYTGWSAHPALVVLRSVVRLHVATLMTQHGEKRILWLIHELLWPSKTLSTELPYTGWSAHPALVVLRSVVRLHGATLMTQHSIKRILWLIHELFWHQRLFPQSSHTLGDQHTLHWLSWGQWSDYT